MTALLTPEGIEAAGRAADEAVGYSYHPLSSALFVEIHLQSPGRDLLGVRWTPCPLVYAACCAHQWLTGGPVGSQPTRITLDAEVKIPFLWRTK